MTLVISGLAVRPRAERKALKVLESRKMVGMRRAMRPRRRKRRALRRPPRASQVEMGNWSRMTLVGAAEGG
jgi:hypothetical protein